MLCFLCCLCCSSAFLSLSCYTPWSPQVLPYPALTIQHLTLAVLCHSNEILIQRSHTEVHQAGPCSHRQLPRWSYHLLNSILLQLPMSHLRIWGEFLDMTFLGKACKEKHASALWCLGILVNPLLGSMEAESSWMLPTSGTAHKSGQRCFCVTFPAELSQRWWNKEGPCSYPSCARSHQEDSRTVYFSCRENWLYHK